MSRLNEIAMDDKTLVEMLAGWSDSEFAVVASGEYCEDLKSRIEGELAKQADTIEAQATRIEALEAALRDIKIEAMREKGSWAHLKRVILLKCKQALESQP